MKMMGRRAAIWLGILASFWAAGCGGGSNSGGGGGGTTKTTPTVMAWPTAGAITYGQTLASSVLTGGTASVSGAFAWTTVTTAPGAGSPSEGVTFTPSDTTDYNTVAGSVGVVVSKATPTVSAWPTASAITYGQTLASSTLSGGTTSVAGAFSWTMSTIVPSGGTPSESVTFTPTDATDYNTVAGSANVTVNRATPAVSAWPTASAITSGQTLASSTLTGGSASVPGSFSWTNPATVPPAGTTSEGVTFTATDAADYNTVAGSVSVTVNPAVAYTLTVNSAAPSSGIMISPVSPADNNGASSGTTPFTRSYPSGTQVTLSAPLSYNSYSFVSWSGCASTSGSGGINCNVTVSANTTVTANYNQAGVSSITVAPSTATIGAQQQFTATVHGTGNYTSGVTWSLGCPLCAGLSPGTLSATGLYNTPYPAPASVTITATSTMTGFTNVSGNATVTLSPPATASGPALTVDVGRRRMSENPHTISPVRIWSEWLWYGFDLGEDRQSRPRSLGRRCHVPVQLPEQHDQLRFRLVLRELLGRGDHVPNAGSSSNFTQFFQGVDNVGAAALGTVPVLGWVANNTQNACSFTKTAYPNQVGQNGNAAFDPYNSQCGYGVYAEGYGGCTSSQGCSIYGSNTIAQITSTPEPAPSITDPATPLPGSSSSALTAWANGTWSGAWVNSIASNPSYGNGASGKGVAMWDLDNEPTWWDAVHRDVHPVAFTYDEVTNNGIGTALAIKTADPTALVSGPVIDYWEAYFYSKKDIESGWSSGSPCYKPWSNPTDRIAHGGVPMIEYYLQQFAKYSSSSYYNTRLLDYLDIHGYFAPSYNGNSVAFTTAGDTQAQTARMNGTRVFWDPTYTDPNDPQPNYITDSNYTTSCSPPPQAPQLIPMMQKWVANDYPEQRPGSTSTTSGAWNPSTGRSYRPTFWAPEVVLVDPVFVPG